MHQWLSNTSHTLSRWAQRVFIQREREGEEGTPPPWERERAMVKRCGRVYLVTRRSIPHWEMHLREMDFHDGSFHIDKGDLEMALAKHHYPFSALMRQLSEFPHIKRAISTREVQRYCGILEQDGCFLRGCGFFHAVLPFPAHPCQNMAICRSLKSHLTLVNNCMIISLQ